ncbi:hypothetical protein FCM35_KLT17316 [Carex littledalei]|uniref:Uncharacterized protein n=1 Tax=Carex littledalei TaxID=544730 RepID=A0A833RR10_9POAL|nr:hypothetical protein FCM35_KLT17316 [Carex littledalei]
MTPKRFLILAVMFLLVTGSLLPELAADHSSENKEAENNIAVGVTGKIDDPKENRLRCRYIAVGDGPFLLSYGQQYQPYVIGAATNIHTEGRDGERKVEKRGPHEEMEVIGRELGVVADVAAKEMGEFGRGRGKG